MGGTFRRSAGEVEQLLNIIREGLARDNVVPAFTREYLTEIVAAHMAADKKKAANMKKC
jgi:hypothetical protein